MASAVLGLVVVFVSLALYAVHYYSARGDLKLLASQSAAFAGYFLPNPVLACQRAHQAFAAMKTDVGSPSGLVTGGIVSNLSASVDISYYDGSLAGVLTKKTYPTLASCTTSALVQPPVQSLSVTASAEYDLGYVNLAGLSNWATLSATASASTQLVPTDVVLVIENSNSVLGPMMSLQPVEGYGPFQVFNNTIGRLNGATLSYEPGGLTAVNKADVRAAQCFGKVYKDIKTAAMKAFDLLSASSSFRVGVVHTLHTGGEFPPASVNITAASYAEAYHPWSVAELQAREADTDSLRLFRVPGANSAYGSEEYPESRCAAIAGQYPSGGNGKLDEHPLPAHPLAAAYDSAWLNSNLKNFLLPKTLVPLVNGASDPFAMLKFDTGDSTIRLMPRDMIWLNSAGLTDGSGYPNQKGDFTLFQSALLRARDLLLTAPARADGQAVRRKVILVFADGLERPGIDFKPLEVFSDRSFNRVEDAYADETTFILESYGSEANFAGNFCNEGLVRDDSEVDLDSITANEDGIKLGVLLYQKDAAYNWSDTQLRFMDVMPGHNTGDTSLDAHRDYCNTPWAARRGRFMLEPKAEVGDDPGTIYSDDVVPEAARALFETELIR